VSAENYLQCLASKNPQSNIWGFLLYWACMILQILFVLFVIIFSSAAYAGFSAAPWLPTRKKEISTLLNSIQIKNNEIVYDLGCGTGSILFALANKYPNAQLIGYEISILPFLIALSRKVVGGKKYTNVSIRFKNLFKQNLRDADVIIIFLLNSAYKKLINKLQSEVKIDCTIIVEAWPLPNLKATKIEKTENALSLYFYQGSEFKNLV